MGDAFNLDDGEDNIEVVGAYYAIADMIQALLFQGNFSTGGGTLSTEDGLYNTNGTDGLRTLSKGAGTSINKPTLVSGDFTTTYMGVINRAVGQLRNAGSQAQNLIMACSVNANEVIDAEFQNFYRIVGSRPDGGLDLNLTGAGVKTTAQRLAQFMQIPANQQASGMGYYTYSGNATEDIYILDKDEVQFGYLGSPSPMLFELPIGYNNFFSQMYIPLMMLGVLCYRVEFMRKIRIPQAPS
jgi:hypothetical protein